MDINKPLKLTIIRLDVATIALQKIIQGLVGLGIALLISTLLNLEYQGYFYTLVNFSSAYTLLDLGLSALMVQVSASFFAKTKMTYHDLLKQDLDNIFLDLILWSRRYFIIVSLLSLSFIPAGYLFLLKSVNNPSVEIIFIPLALAIFMTALSIPAIAILSFIEGFGKIKEVYSLRIIISILGGFLAAILIINGHSLLAPSMMPLAICLTSYPWAYMRYKNLFFIKERSFKHKDIKWKSNFDDLRNKVKLTSIGIFFFQSGPTLIFFYFFSPHQAGQVGLSSAFLGMGLFIASAFFIAKIPELSKLVSSKKTDEARRIFQYEFRRAMILTFIGYIIWLIFICFITNTKLGERFLSPINMSMLVINFVVIQIATLLNYYSRSFGKEVMAHSFFIATMLGVLISILFHGFLGVSGCLLIMNISYLFLCFPQAIKYLFTIKNSSKVEIG
jgi:hypothetical protein